MRKHTIPLMFLVVAMGLVLSATAALGDAGVIDAGVVAEAADAGVAAPTLPTDPTEAEFLKEAYGKVKDGQWTEFVAMLVILLTWVSRKWGVKLLKAVKLGHVGSWLSETDRGGVATAGLVALSGAIAHSLWIGADIDADLLRSTAKVVAEAMGGYTGLRILLGLKSAK